MWFIDLDCDEYDFRDEFCFEMCLVLRLVWWQLKSNWFTVVKIFWFHWDYNFFSGEMQLISVEIGVFSVDKNMISAEMRFIFVKLSLIYHQRKLTSLISIEMMSVKKHPISVETDLISVYMSLISVQISLISVEKSLFSILDSASSILCGKTFYF